MVANITVVMSVHVQKEINMTIDCPHFLHIPDLH